MEEVNEKRKRRPEASKGSKEERKRMKGKEIKREWDK
jgi:hypothetical protein